MMVLDLGHSRAHSLEDARVRFHDIADRLGGADLEHDVLRL